MFKTPKKPLFSARPGHSRAKGQLRRKDATQGSTGPNAPTSLARSASKASQEISYRKSKERLADDAHTESLAHSTIGNLKKAEEERLEKAQQKLVKDVLKEHDKILDEHAAEENSCDSIIEKEFSEEIEEEAEAMYTYFTSEHHLRIMVSQ